MKILSWNVNGIRAAEKKGFLEWLRVEVPDILCLQETKVDPKELDDKLKNIQGYHCYWSSPEEKGYSGVAIFSKEKPHAVQIGFGNDRFDSEGRLIMAEYEKFILLNVYFPNGKMSPERYKYKMEFYDYFLSFVNNLHKSGKHIVFCGDINTAHKEIDIARPKENSKLSGFLPEERAWIDKVIAEGYVDVYREMHPLKVEYSYWDIRTGARKRNVGWRIDAFFVSKDFAKHVKNAFILTDVTGSDHCPVGIEID